MISRIALALVATTFGCRQSGDAGTPSYEATVEFVAGEQARVTVNGKMVPTRIADDGNAVFSYSNERDRIALTLNTPCGIKPVETTFTPARGGLGRLVPEGHVPSSSVIIDNRNQPATKLAIGEVAWTAPANRVSVYKVPFWDCGEKPVTKNGSSIGLARPSTTMSLATNVLIDVAGTHCYRIRGQHYGLATGGEEADLQSVPPGHVRHTPEIDRLFEDLRGSSPKSQEFSINDCR